MMWTDNPERDAERYAADIERWEQKFPVCECCGEHIVSGEEYVEIGGKYYHTECLWNTKRTMEEDYDVAI